MGARDSPRGVSSARGARPHVPPPPPQGRASSSVPRGYGTVPRAYVISPRAGESTQELVARALGLRVSATRHCTVAVTQVVPPGEVFDGLELRGTLPQGACTLLIDSRGVGHEWDVYNGAQLTDTVRMMWSEHKRNACVAYAGSSGRGLQWALAEVDKDGVHANVRLSAVDEGTNAAALRVLWLRRRLNLIGTLRGGVRVSLGLTKTIYSPLEPGIDVDAAVVEYVPGDLDDRLVRFIAAHARDACVRPPPAAPHGGPSPGGGVRRGHGPSSLVPRLVRHHSSGGGARGVKALAETAGPRPRGCKRTHVRHADANGAAAGGGSTASAIDRIGRDEPGGGGRARSQGSRKRQRRARSRSATAAGTAPSEDGEGRVKDAGGSASAVAVKGFMWEGRWTRVEVLTPAVAAAVDGAIEAAAVASERGRAVTAARRDRHHARAFDLI